MVFMVTFTNQFLKSLHMCLLFRLYVKAYSKEICEELSFLSFSEKC